MNLNLQRIELFSEMVERFADAAATLTCLSTENTPEMKSAAAACADAAELLAELVTDELEKR